MRDGRASHLAIRSIVPPDASEPGWDEHDDREDDPDGRLWFEVVSAIEVPGGVQAVVRVTVELEGSEKPAAVVDTVSRFLE